MSSLGALLWLGYRLNRHKLGPVPLSGLALMAGALAWGGAWRGWLSLVQAAVISLICWALAGIGLWARWQGYLRFRAEDTPPSLDVPVPLPDEHVPLRASGRFEVMHKRRDFIGAQAAFSTMDSGEHVIMAYTSALASCCWANGPWRRLDGGTSSCRPARCAPSPLDCFSLGPASGQRCRSAIGRTGEESRGCTWLSRTRNSALACGPACARGQIRLH